MGTMQCLLSVRRCVRGFVERASLFCIRSFAAHCERPHNKLFCLRNAQTLYATCATRRSATDRMDSAIPAEAPHPVKRRIRKKCLCEYNSRCCTGAPSRPAQETSAPPQPAQSVPWRYSRPKDNGGALQPHLDVFKGYARYVQYPAEAVADVDWQAVVRKVLSTQTHSWGAREVSEAALYWARSVCPDMTGSRLSQLQSLGAWTMDYSYSARRVEQNRARAGIAFIPVPNAS